MNIFMKEKANDSLEYKTTEVPLFPQKAINMR
jgi:hypothetical protein